MLVSEEVCASVPPASGSVATLLLSDSWKGWDSVSLQWQESGRRSQFLWGQRYFTFQSKGSVTREEDSLILSQWPQQWFFVNWDKSGFRKMGLEKRQKLGSQSGLGTWFPCSLDPEGLTKSCKSVSPGFQAHFRNTKSSMKLLQFIQCCPCAEAPDNWKMSLHTGHRFDGADCWVLPVHA